MTHHMAKISPALQEKYDGYYSGESDWRTLGDKQDISSMNQD